MKYTHLTHFLSNWICAWWGLIDSLITIITFGYVMTSFSYNCVFARAINMSKKKLAKRSEKEVI